MNTQTQSVPGERNQQIDWWGGRASGRTVAFVQVGVLLLPVALYLAALKPGLMSADSLSSWYQFDTGDWVDVHPPLYTALMWLSATLVSSPFLLTIGQAIFAVTGLWALASASVDAGASRRWTWLAAAAVACSPMFGSFSASLWKDVPYTGAFLWLLAHTLRCCIAARQGSRPVMVHEARWVVVFAGLMTVFRQNGILVVAAMLVALAVFIPAVRRTCLIGVLLLGGLLACLKLVAYPALGIDESPPYFSLFHVFHDIAAVVTHSPDALDEDDLALVEATAPVDRWRLHYSCSTVNALLYSPEMKIADVGQDRDRVVDVWSDLAMTRPWTVLGNRLCVARHSWDPFPSAGELYTVSHGIDDNPFGLRSTPVVQGLRTWAIDAVEWTDSRPQKGILWRAPPWLYLLYAGLVVGAFRNRARSILLLLAVPLLAHQAAYVLISPAQDTRYMFPTLLAAVVLLPLGWSAGPLPRSTVDAADA